MFYWIKFIILHSHFFLNFQRNFRSTLQRLFFPYEIYSSNAFFHFSHLKTLQSLMNESSDALRLLLLLTMMFCTHPIQTKRVVDCPPSPKKLCPSREYFSVKSFDIIFYAFSFCIPMCRLPAARLRSLATVVLSPNLLSYPIIIQPNQTTHWGRSINQSFSICAQSWLRSYCLRLSTYCT